MTKIALVFGTRPEAIKIAPVYFALRDRGCQVDLINTGQHRELLTPLLELFQLEPRFNLDAMRPNQSLPDLTATLVARLGQIVATETFDHMLVQGDTTSAFAAALAAFYQRVPVGHIEAGLRTQTRYSPFPEEINRRLISAIATHHFTPTPRASANLIREGIDNSAILMTGNTVIDSLRWLNETHSNLLDSAVKSLGVPEKQYILMTTHRRENFGEAMLDIFQAVRGFLRAHSDVSLVLPLHRNPNSRDVALEVLRDEKNAVLIEAQNYVAFCGLMKNCLFIVTDSGGVQEEAPYFNKRTLVIRDTTERPEAIEAGVAALVGTNSADIRKAMEAALLEARSGAMPDLVSRNPFGDGFASDRIASLLLSANARL